MKHTILTATMLLALCASQPHACASSTPWIGSMSTNDTITVPAGKILMIEQVSQSQGTGTGTYRFTVTGTAAGGVGNGAFSADIYFTVPVSTITKVPCPLRVGPGMTIKLITANAVIALMGTVIDSTDFFALANPITTNVAAENGVFTATIDSRTSAPTKVTPEKSFDLRGWDTTGIVVSKSSSNPRISRIITPIDVPTKFARAEVTPVTATAACCN